MTAQIIPLHPARRHLTLARAVLADPAAHPARPMLPRLARAVIATAEGRPLIQTPPDRLAALARNRARLARDIGRDWPDGDDAA